MQLEGLFTQISCNGVYFCGINTEQRLQCVNVFLIRLYCITLLIILFDLIYLYLVVLIFIYFSLNQVSNKDNIVIASSFSDSNYAYLSLGSNCLSIVTDNGTAFYLNIIENYARMVIQEEVLTRVYVSDFQLCVFNGTLRWSVLFFIFYFFIFLFLSLWSSCRLFIFSFSFSCSFPFSFFIFIYLLFIFFIYLLLLFFFLFVYFYN